MMMVSQRNSPCFLSLYDYSCLSHCLSKARYYKFPFKSASHLISFNYFICLFILLQLSKLFLLLVNKES